MRRFQRAAGWILAIVFATPLNACHHPAAPAKVATAPSNLISRVFTVDLLGEQVAYLEKTIGPPIHIQDSEREYVIDGCRMHIPDAQAVDWFRFDLSEHCGFDPTPFLLSGFKPRQGLTFGEFATAVAGEATVGADCVNDCGNGGPADVSEFYAGPHSDNFIEVRLDADRSDAASEAIIKKWGEQLEKDHGEQWMDDRKYNCGDAALHPEPLKLVRVASITIGHHVKTPDSDCPTTSTAPDAANGPKPLDLGAGLTIQLGERLASFKASHPAAQCLPSGSTNLCTMDGEAQPTDCLNGQTCSNVIFQFTSDILSGTLANYDVDSYSASLAAATNAFGPPKRKMIALGPVLDDASFWEFPKGELAFVHHRGTDIYGQALKSPYSIAFGADRTILQAPVQ